MGLTTEERKRLYKKCVRIGLDGDAFCEMVADKDAEIGYYLGMIKDDVNYTFACISVKGDPLLHGLQSVLHSCLATLYSKDLITKEEWDNFLSEGKP